MSKTQQVKQYKKHIDQLNDEIAVYKQQAEQHKEQVSTTCMCMYKHIHVYVVGSSARECTCTCMYTPESNCCF